VYSAARKLRGGWGLENNEVFGCLKTKTTSGILPDLLLFFEKMHVSMFRVNSQNTRRFSFAPSVPVCVSQQKTEADERLARHFDKTKP
jgi:hypothetical protein